MALISLRHQGLSLLTLPTSSERDLAMAVSQPPLQLAPNAGFMTFSNLSSELSQRKDLVSKSTNTDFLGNRNFEKTSTSITTMSSSCSILEEIT
jgi:hypothetical protein